MLNICCTAKLLKRTGFTTDSQFPEPTTALGNWFVNLLFYTHLQVLLFVSENSRLPLITPARDVKSMANHLTRQLPALLEYLGAPSNWIDAEIHEMSDVHFTTTHSRSVLGTMNDYDTQIAAMVQHSRDIVPIQMARLLSECPVGPLKYKCPREVSLELIRRRYSAG